MAYQDHDADDVVYVVREEPPQLLWRSIVAGFGFALGVLLLSLLMLLGRRGDARRHGPGALDAVTPAGR